MKSKVFFSVLLITCLFASCGLIRKDDPNNPTIEQYFIKHSWGSGADADWEWREMTKVADNFEYEGLWGGYGANINKKANDNGAYWFPKDAINGASNLVIGDGVKFTYVPATETLSAEKTSDGPRAKLRFRKKRNYQSITSLAIDQFDETGALTEVAHHDFGANAGTSSYYEIPANIASIPNYMENESWVYVQDLYCVFDPGTKYTYACGDENDSIVFTITVDGTYNTPAKSQVVMRKSYSKTDIMNNKEIRGFISNK